MAGWLGIDQRLMGEDLFKTERTLPVLADLEEGLFDPVSGHLFRRTEIVGARDARRRSEQERVALLYYRAFLQYVNGVDRRYP
jgi:hypothetical protein